MITLKNILILLSLCMSALTEFFKSTSVYNCEWNASGFTSGVYYYQLKTDGYIDTKKMILMK